MTVCLVDALLLTSCCCSSSDQILVVLAQDQSSHSPGCSGVVGAGPAKAMVHHAAVLRLQAVGDVLLYLLTAPQEPAAIPSQLLPWAPPVLLLLSTDEDLVHVVREAYLRVRPESTCKPRAGQLLQGGGHQTATPNTPLGQKLFGGFSRSSRTYSRPPATPSVLC